MAKKSADTISNPVVVDPVQSMIDHAGEVFEGHSGLIGVEFVLNGIIQNPDGDGLVKVELLKRDASPRRFKHKEGNAGPSKGFYVSGKAPDPTSGDSESFQVGVNIIKIRSNTW